MRKHIVWRNTSSAIVMIAIAEGVLLLSNLPNEIKLGLLLIIAWSIAIVHLICIPIDISIYEYEERRRNLGRTFRFGRVAVILYGDGSSGFGSPSPGEDTRAAQVAEHPHRARLSRIQARACIEKWEGYHEEV